MQFVTAASHLIFAHNKEFQMSRNRRPYGCLAFLFDIVMICVTWGFWLVWIFVREMRNRR